MIVSIVICTHNRPDDLESCMASLAPQVDFDRAEVIVIDSASNEASVARYNAILALYPLVQLFRANEVGLSNARNLAVSQASGDWIAFLDDDTLPVANYFSSLLKVLDRVPATVGVWGGRLVPKWPGEPLKSIGARWFSLLSLIDDETTDRVAESGLVYGANAIYRGDIIRRLDPPFNPKLGRVGNCLLSGEETNLQIFIAKLGYETRYYGSVVVEHVIPEGRLSKAWLQNRAYWEGITLVALTQASGEKYPRGANPWFQSLKIALLLPTALFADRGKDAYAKIWTSLGVIRARWFGIPHMPEA